MVWLHTSHTLKVYKKDHFHLKLKSLTKKKANIATQDLPITAAGTKSVDFAYLAMLALQANPKAVIKPNKSP